MQGVRFLTFGVSNSLTHTALHLFPSSGNVSAPYPATCKLTLFGANVERKSVTLEGLRLSQPDGIFLDQAFPNLREGVAGFYGIEIVLSSNQPRVDLSFSQCIVELFSRIQTVRFRPVLLGGADNLERTTVAVKDSFFSSSIVAVNGSQAAINPLFLARDPSDITAEINIRPSLEISPHSVHETEIFAEGSKLLPAEMPVIETSFGLSRMTPVYVREEPSPHTAYYALYRDGVTKRIVSVCAL